MIKKIKVVQAYKFSKIVDNRIYLTTRGWHDRPGKLYELRIKQNTNQNFHVDIDYEFSVTPKKLFLQRILPEAILSLFGKVKYKGYLNDVIWIDNQTLAITLRNGSGIYVYSTKNRSGNYYFIKNSIPSRFLDGSNYADRIFFVDDGNKKIIELEVN